MKNLQENTCVRPEACNFIKKETLAQVFSCEFCEISKNTFFHRTPLVAASEQYFLRVICFFASLNFRNSVLHIERQTQKHSLFIGRNGFGNISSS